VNRSIIIGAVVALATPGTTGQAQAPREQRMPFGGGGQFEFAIPVMASGPLYIEATWTPATALAASLFVPGSPQPMAEASGSGRVIVSHDVTTWRAGQPYVLRLGAPDPAVNVRGTLRVVWPSGNRPGVAVQWRNAGPTDRAVRDVLTHRVAALGRAVRVNPLVASTDPATMPARADATNSALVDVLATRLAVLSLTPARYVINDAGLEAVGGAPLFQPPLRAGTIAVDFTGLVMHRAGPFHVEHERDAAYVVAVILPEGDAAPSVGRTNVMRSLRPGRAYAAGGGQTLALAAAPVSRIVVATFEREAGSPDLAMARLLQAARLFQLYRSASVEPVDGDFPWFAEALLAEAREALIGAPVLLRVTSHGVARPDGSVVRWAGGAQGSRRATVTLPFESSAGASVSVRLSVGVSQP
jgi:hypothetical protein